MHGVGDVELAKDWLGTVSGRKCQSTALFCASEVVLLPGRAAGKFRAHKRVLHAAA